MYNPPAKEPRAFAEDYRNGAETDESGKLKTTIEGRPFTAPFIAGRTSRTGLDQAVTPAQFDAISEKALGSPPLGVPKGRVPGGGVGAFDRTVVNNAPSYSIQFDKSLDPQSLPKVVGHELGHMIDELSSRIDTEPLMKELPGVPTAF